MSTALGAEHQIEHHAVKPKKELPEALKKNLWQKGAASPNPTGRKKGAGITDALLAIMAQVDDKTGLTGAQEIALATFKLAKKGHPIALREVWERIEGKVKVEIDVNTESQLWQRLNEGRMRLSAKVTTETQHVSPDGDMVTTSTERSISYDAPAPDLEPILEAIASHVEGSEPTMLDGVDNTSDGSTDNPAG